MGMRPHRSLLSQLLIVFSVFAVLVAIAAIFGYVGVARQTSAAKELTGRDYVLQQAAGRMQEGFTTSQIAISSFAMSGNNVFLAPLPAARAKFTRELRKLQTHSPARLRGWVAEQTRAGAQLFAVAGRITRLPAGSPAARGLATGTALIARDFYRSNSSFQEYLAAEVRRVTEQSKNSLTAGLFWGGIALGVAVVLVLAASLSTLRTVTWPLQRLTATVRRLTSGDYAARAVVTGSAEVREVAQAVNLQADGSDRLRMQEAESNRLRAMARAAGIRIREHLAADDVLGEARAVLEENVDADSVHLHVVTDGQVSRPIGHEDDQTVAASLGFALTQADIQRLQDLFRRQSSELVQDLRGPDAEQVQPRIVAAMLEAGIVSYLVTPFGVGDEMLGFVAAERLGPSRRPWHAAEVDAVESIAADLGRGLHHARLYEAENRLVKDLQSLDEAKSDFFATVSHELRAPLTSIEGYVEMLRDGEAGPVNAEQDGMLQAVDRSAVRLRNLIEDVFMLAKLESGAFRTLRRPVNLAEVIAGAVEVLRPSVASKGLSLATDIPKMGLIVEGDAGQLDRAIMNLLSNAVKFTPEQGHVQLTASAEGGSAVVRISDSGIGIPEQERGELFSRFYRASNARAQAIPGTGLGLPIVRTIVANHNGEVQLQSQQDAGTVVTVRLPLLAALG